MNILTNKDLDDRGVPYSRTQRWRKARDPNDPFPVPVKFGANRIGWFEDEINAWLASRPRVPWASGNDAPPEVA